MGWRFGAQLNAGTRLLGSTLQLGALALRPEARPGAWTGTSALELCLGVPPGARAWRSGLELSMGARLWNLALGSARGWRLAMRRSDERRGAMPGNN